MDPRAAERRRKRSLGRRLSTLGRLAVGWSLGAVVMVFVVLQGSVPVEDLVLDQNVVSGAAWYVGLVTSVAVLIWTSAAAGAAAACYAARTAGRRRASLTFRAAYVGLGFLVADELFQLHSAVLPPLLGVSKTAVMGAEVLAVGTWAVLARSELVRTRWELLVAGGAAFATSIVVDQTRAIDDPVAALAVEDGAKLLGVIALATWSVSSAADLIRSVATATSAPAEAVPPSVEAAPLPVGAASPIEPPAAAPIPNRRRTDAVHAVGVAADGNGDAGIHHPRP